MDYSITAEIIRSARIRRGITQKELAARLGVTNTAVSKWERGLGMPDVSLLRPLCEALRIAVSALLGDEGGDAAAGRDGCLSLNQINTPIVGTNSEEKPMTFEIDTGRAVKLSPYTRPRFRCGFPIPRTTRVPLRSSATPCAWTSDTPSTNGVPLSRESSARFPP